MGCSTIHAHSYNPGISKDSNALTNIKMYPWDHDPFLMDKSLALQINFCAPPPIFLISLEY